MNPKMDAVEISSTQIHTDLKEIKERIAALETIASLANRPTVEAYVRTVLTSPAIKAIVAACETPKTKEELRKESATQTSRPWIIILLKFDNMTSCSLKQMTMAY